MLSESEQKRLADIEAALRNDTRFVNGFNRAMTRRITPRRVTAVVIAVAAVIGAIVGLSAHSVPATVLAICGLGVAGGVWTYRSAASPEPPPASDDNS
jgi:nitrate/nitrite transporter NarK